MKEQLRFPCIPLVTVDPYFSIWSKTDELYADSPRHWTGWRQNMTGVLKVDDKDYIFMGKVHFDGVMPDEQRFVKLRCPDGRSVKYMKQLSVNVYPIRTVYEFECMEAKLTVTFFTPLFADDLMVASRPVSYISYKVETKDEENHDFGIYFDISAEAAVDENTQSVKFAKYENGAYVGRGEEGVLNSSGDSKRIDWGWLHIFAEDMTPVVNFTTSRDFWTADEEDGECIVRDKFPSIGLKKEFFGNAEGFLCLGYDDIHSIMYFGKPIDAYYKKDGATFSDACKMALDEYGELIKRAEKFDAELIAEASEISPEYADILCAAYRQSFAAHKVTWDGEEIQFLSKECFSNGCIGTVDVTYPSIPMFLKYNPELVLGMLNPVFRFAKSDSWPFDFAPHDVGQYPLANGQVYGLVEETGELLFKSQMPVEECGNMILCVAAYSRYTGSYEYFKDKKDILTAWAQYLIKYGADPENQLCTDDFAGHLAHNCNLSVKAIVALGAFADLLQRIGEDGSEYKKIAREYADNWVKTAFDGDHYRLTFDGEGTWSLKYNMVWDRLLNLGIFDESVAKCETDYYLTKINEFGVPLDCRSDYTKSDWQMWSTCLCDNPEYEREVIERMWKFLNETPDRIPFTDWFFTSTSHWRGFANRTVQGGLFIKLLTKLD